MNIKTEMSLITVTYNRPTLLETVALPSILNQTHKNFEWIIVNDGKNARTKDLIESLDVDFTVNYLEMEHLENGFSLCAGKNLAIANAKTDLIGYIDDDNVLYPNYSQEIVKAFKEKNCSYLMAQQNRWKHIYSGDNLIRKEGPHLSPIPNSTLKDLVIPNKNSYFDSNGFAHRKTNAPLWDLEYKIFCDYTYLLNSIRTWGVDSFHFLEEDLVDYIQTSNGVIGSSNYTEWAEEFSRIWNTPSLRESCELFDGGEWLPRFITYFEKKAQEIESIQGFQTQEKL
jgi:glycosyltransferase involved in cell wall biosynthesis